MGESPPEPDRPRVLATNDDGIDAPGLAALYEELSAVADVTVIAPAENQSGVGRTRSHRTAREDHPWGAAIDGTPADCVAYGICGLDREFDLVVSGCNHGPNAGNYVFGRSGTVGACVEAAFLDTPAVAVSAYHAEEFFVDPAEAYDYGRPARVARELVVRATAADAFAEADLLNVNVPVDVADPPMRLTEPHTDYDVRIEHDPDDGGGGADLEMPGNEAPETEGARRADVALRDAVWPGTVGWENPFATEADLRERYPVGTDRRSLVEGEISVSPLTAMTTPSVTGEFEGIVAAFNENARERGRASED